MDAQTRSEAFAFLKRQQVMALATVSSKGEPQVATMYYSVDDDFHFYVATARETKKFANIQKNPKVGFSIGAGPEIVAIQGGGEAEWDFRASPDLLIEAAERFNVQASPYWPLTKLPHSGIVIVRITPAWMVFLTLAPDREHENSVEGYRRLIP